MAVLAFLLTAAPARADTPGPTFGNPYVYTEQGGKALYQNVCAACHMPAGQGAQGAGAYPSLQHNQHLAAPAYPIAVIVHGQRAMPPFARSLNDGQIASVVTYIRNHFGNAYPDPATPADVQAARASTRSPP
jgi:mono/diheme cytochrome c family protein